MIDIIKELEEKTIKYVKIETEVTSKVLELIEKGIITEVEWEKKIISIAKKYGNAHMNKQLNFFIKIRDTFNKLA